MTELQELQRLAGNALRVRQDRGEQINPETILETATKIVELIDVSIDGDQLHAICTTLQMQFSMNLSERAITLANPEVPRGWLASLDDPERTAFNYYNVFKEHLTNEGRPIRVIKENENIIDDILDLSGDPLTSGAWQRRGLVMGNVQSGKTQNYTALVNKAADLGYKAIIILGGHQNELRRQTQQRIDSGFTGKNSLFGSGEVIGVGKLRNLNVFGTHEGTGERDFNTLSARTFTFNLAGFTFPAVFVVKKNVSVLKTLYRWIEDNHQLNPDEGVKLDLPLLFIDDEADYASPNTKQASDDITATNEIIRKIHAGRTVRRKERMDQGSWRTGTTCRHHGYQCVQGRARNTKCHG